MVDKATPTFGNLMNGKLDLGEVSRPQVRLEPVEAHPPAQRHVLLACVVKLGGRCYNFVNIFAKNGKLHFGALGRLKIRQK
jgi:hypothetical protein